MRDQPGQPPCRALIDAVLAGHRVVDACGHRAAGQREAGGGPGEHDVVGRRFRWHGEGVDGRGQFADVDGGQQSMPRQASASRSSVPQTRQCGRDHDQPRRGEQVPGPQRQPSAHLGGRDQRGQRERQPLRLGEPPQVGAIIVTPRELQAESHQVVRDQIPRQHRSGGGAPLEQHHPDQDHHQDGHRLHELGRQQSGSDEPRVDEPRVESESREGPMGTERPIDAVDRGSAPPTGTPAARTPGRFRRPARSGRGRAGPADRAG